MVKALDLLRVRGHKLGGGEGTETQQPGRFLNRELGQFAHASS
jgi:hypothetical protein